MHYAFDKWLKQEYPQIEFVRYMDDIVVHCVSQKQAEYILAMIRKRLNQCKLELNEEKTCIVYCKKGSRKENYPKVTFDFLGYGFRPMSSYNKKTKQRFLGFDTSISKKSRKKILKQVEERRKSMNRCVDLEEVADILNPRIRGWLNYYGHIGKRNMSGVFLVINIKLVKWLKKKNKKLNGSLVKSFSVLEKIRKAKPKLFAHWAAGF